MLYKTIMYQSSIENCLYHHFIQIFIPSFNNMSVTSYIKLYGHDGNYFAVEVFHGTSHIFDINTFRPCLKTVLRPSKKYPCVISLSSQGYIKTLKVGDTLFLNTRVTR